MSRMHLVSTAAPLKIGSPLKGPRARAWTGAEPIIRVGGGDPVTQLDRTAFHATTQLGGGVVAVTGADAATRPVQTQRLLTADQYHLIYQRTPDVRACIDSIVRRVATQDWDVIPYVDPSDADFEAAMAEAIRVREWLQTPTANGDTFQEVATAWLTDLLKYDAGVLELVEGARGVLSEMVPVRGCDVHPVVDVHGRLLSYVQDPRYGVGVVAGNPASVTTLAIDQVLYLRLFPTTEHPEGIPLLETLVYEIIGILRAAEFVTASLNLNEVPPGLLVVTGIAQDAAKKMRAEYESKAAQEWSMRILAGETATAPLDAKWVEFRKAPRELQIVELARWMQRAIWRVFGVKPIELGETEGIPRASAEVQVDVSASHLLTPILELVQAKFNAVVLSRVIAPEWQGRIGFEWLTQREMSPAEKKDKAEELGRYVDSGILTRNEVRDALGYAPIEGGDEATVKTVKGAVIPLRIAMQTADEVVATETGGDNGDDEEDDDERPASEDGDAFEGEEEEADDKDEDDDERKRPVLRRPIGALAARGWKRPQTLRTRHGHRHAVARGRIEDTPPPEWATLDEDSSARTLNLGKLWEEVSGYARDVLPLWEEARAAMVSAVAAEYVEEGFDSERRQIVVNRVADEIERLVSRWSLTTARRYEAVALDARAQAGNWTGRVTDADATRAYAANYRRRAMSYLVEQGGLVNDLHLRVLGILFAVTDTRGAPPPDQRLRLSDLLPKASTVEVLSAVGAAFDSFRHRVGNWAAKLIELANEVLISEVDQGVVSASTESSTPEAVAAAAEPWCEWVCPQDERSCEVCRDLSARGFMRMADLPTTPGGDTNCRSNCRCVLVIWSKEEIDGGTAHLMSGKVR